MKARPHLSLHEEAYRRLMRLHFAAGDRAAALHAYDACRAKLSTDMRTEPTQETVALASRMRAVTPPQRKVAPKIPWRTFSSNTQRGPHPGTDHRVEYLDQGVS